MGSITVEPNVGVIIDGMKVTFPKNTETSAITYTVNYYEKDEDVEPVTKTNVVVRAGDCGCIDESNVTFAANALTITNITITGVKALPKEISISLNYDESSPESATWSTNIGTYITFNKSAGKATLKEEIIWDDVKWPKNYTPPKVTTASTPAIKVVQFGCDPVIKQATMFTKIPKLSLEIRTDYSAKTNNDIDHIDVWCVRLLDSNTAEGPLDYNVYFNYISAMVPYYETKNLFLKTYQTRLEMSNITDSDENPNPVKLYFNHYEAKEPDNVDLNFIDGNSYLYVKNAKIVGTQAGTSITATEDKWIELTDGSKKKVLIHLQYKQPHHGGRIDDGLDNGQSGPLKMEPKTLNNS